MRSINSVKDIVDELVVVDTGSTDDTVKLSQEAGARTEYFEWIGDFSAARNYALGHVSGDIVFFLDADEWFPTALTSEDRNEIEQIFLNTPQIQAIQLVINNLNSQGAVKTSSTANRILRSGQDTRFHKRIHEQFLHNNGALPFVYISNNKWQLDHCGYVEEIFESKMSRNIELLEEAAKNAKTPEERHFQYCYLVREYSQHNALQEALRCLKLVLAEPDMIRKHCFTYDHGFAPLLYIMLAVAKQARESVSRRELQRKVVDTFKKNLASYPGTATIDLYFETFFDLKDDRLLVKIEPALEAARRIPDSPISYYYEAEAVINNQAAQASFRRGKLTAAMEYAVKSFKFTEEQNPHALHVLLSCLRGQPAADIILFLNSQFDLNNPQRLNFLSAGTRVQGFRDIHAYYLDKRIKAELATKGDYLYLLLLYGKHTETVEMAKQIYDDATADTITQIIFLASVCADSEQIFRDNKAVMGKYDDVLEAYFSKKPLESVTDGQFAILAENFPLIAFAAGMERADAFLAVFSVESLLVYKIRTKYCIDSGLFEFALTKEIPDESDYACCCLAVQAMTMSGRLDEAFEIAKSQLELGYMDESLLTYLLALSERAQGTLKTASRMLYDKYMPLYDRLIDLRDIVNTGYIVDDSDKKKAKPLKTLTPAQFKKQLAEDAENPYILGLVEICERAARLFEEKSMPAAALECYRLALAGGADVAGSYASMSRLFGKIGNAALAKELAKIAG